MIKQDDARSKIEEHFIVLEAAVDVGDFEWMQTGMARLSKYYSFFTEEEISKFEEYELIIETGSLSEEYDNYYEPTEYDEWQDYDPDC